jgi:putative ABC transport system permease protein
MTFRQFAFNNVVRNKRTYAAYFLSSAFSVMVFFAYAIFAFHPGLVKASIGAHVANGLHFAEGIIYVFSFFFVLYSMGAFLKTRKKEFGLFLMYGMTDFQLKKLVFLENILIGFFATAGGIFSGLILSKLLLLTAENMLGLEQVLDFYWPVKAVLLTLGAFMLLFVTISFFTVLILKGNKLIELFKSGSKPKPEPRASGRLTLLAVLLLLGGYGVALAVVGITVSYAMIPVTLIVTIGTNFLFTQLSVYGIHRWKRSKSQFWRRTNLLLLSDLAYRMKDNARTFFMVTILSTVAFSAIGSLVGFKTMMTEVFLEENPFAFEYLSYDGKAEQGHIERIVQALDAEGVSYKRFKATMKIQPLSEQDKSAVLVKESEFNALAAAAGESAVYPALGEAVAVHYSNGMMEKAQKESNSLTLTDNAVVLSVKEQIQSFLLPERKVYYIVSDPLFDNLEQSSERNTFYAFDVKGWKNTKEMGKILNQQLMAELSEPKFTFFALAYQLQRLTQDYGAVLFIGLFIGAVFFVAAGSFLYFRLYADLEDDKRKYASIMKLGLTDAELSSVLTKQLMILFYVPIGVALLHGAVALTSMQRMFGYWLVQECALVLGVFFLIQTAYFLLIRSRYIKHIKFNE